MVKQLRLEKLFFNIKIPWNHHNHKFLKEIIFMMFLIQNSLFFKQSKSIETQLKFEKQIKV